MAYADYAHCIVCDRKVVYTEDGAMSPAGGFYDELRSVYCKECGDDLKRQLAAANEHIHTLMVDKDKLFDQAQEMLHDRDKQLAAANERAGRLERDYQKARAAFLRLRKQPRQSTLDVVCDLDDLDEYFKEAPDAL